MLTGAQTSRLLNNLSTVVILLDQEQCIVEANHAAQALLERSLNQLLGCKLEQFIVDSSIDLSRWHQHMQFGESYSDGEVVLSFTDGRHTQADITVSSIEDEQQRFLLLEIRTIEQQKKISQETHQWAQQQASRDLIRGLAHEIKNPLGGIRGAAQLLAKELPSAELKEFTSMIIEQSDRLRNLVDRLLGPNSRPDFKLYNIHQVLEKICALVSLESEGQIEIIRDYDPSIPDTLFDQEMLQQAVLNIVQNSVQALLESSELDREIRLVTRIERQVIIHGDLHPLCAKVSIIDNGPGIPNGLKDTIFYPMVTGRQEGTGLGLSIAQTLISHHQGKIDVESWPGHTEFCLYLPIDSKEATQ